MNLLIDKFSHAWKFLLFIFIGSLLLFVLASTALKDLIESSSLLWLIYSYLPFLIALIYFKVKGELLIKFFIIIEIDTIYRYFLLSLITLGIVFISFSAISSLVRPNALVFLHQLDLITQGFSTLFFLKMVIVAPILEEICFRGIILDGFLEKYSRVKSILLSSLFFSLIHFSLFQLGYTFLLGVLCGWFYSRTKDLLTCIITHSFNNFFAILIIKYFTNNLHNQVITANTVLVKTNHLWMILLVTIAIVFISGYYLNRSISEKE